MKKFEEKNLTKANNTYRNQKRVEKQMATDKQTGPQGQGRGMAAASHGIKHQPATQTSSKYNAAAVAQGASQTQMVKPQANTQ